jgi:hypothetical protein
MWVREELCRKRDAGSAGILEVMKGLFHRTTNDCAAGVSYSHPMVARLEPVELRPGSHRETGTVPIRS